MPAAAYPARPWRTAMQDALYGPAGFYRQQSPAAHFRTSVHASALFAEALVTLARRAGMTTVLDLGAGRGELLEAVHAYAPELSLVAVEVAARPLLLDPAIGWLERMPAGLVDVLVVANEWLDVVPLDVVQRGPDGSLRQVLVDAVGAERLGGPPAPLDAAWLQQWWPVADEPGARAEVGRTRDEAWADAVGCVRRGVLLAVDYSHRQDDRPPFGTLAGYRDGRLVEAVPDGSCDLTAHVALDACAAAGERASATGTQLTTQQVALRALGLRGTLPAYEQARADPTAYARALGLASEARELLGGTLGGFGWLLQCIGVDGPPLD